MSSHEILELERPCKYCSALFLNDADQGGVIKLTKDGARYVDFGTVQVSSFDKIGQIATCIHLDDAYKPMDSPKTDLKLDYAREDSLPDMPSFLKTASDGCSFCSLLRDDIRCAWLSDRRTHPEFENDPAKHLSAHLRITGIHYRLQEDIHMNWGLEQITENNTGLVSLNVFFTVRSEEYDQNYALSYDIYADAADPCASWLQCLRTPVVNSIMSPTSTKRLIALVEKTSGEIKSPKAGTEYIPSRLIDVDADVDGRVRLVTKDDERFKHRTHPTRYIALSYCWGSKEQAKQQLKTTSGSLQEHLDRIIIAKLPKTVADAIQICKLLGIRYLWVDALCIIQDDAADWAQEALEMANVYSNSHLTLCILRGSSCLDGFVESNHAPRTLAVNFSSVLDPTVKGRLHLRMLQPPGKSLDVGHEAAVPPLGRSIYQPGDLDFQDVVWHTRAWTFQEAKLSPRNLYVGEAMFHISCGTVHESADGSRFSDRLGLIDSDASLNKHMQAWYSWASDYSRRDLTYEKDRLPAFAAMAKTVSNRFPGEEYVAGLWKSDLHKGLLWTSESWTTFEDHFKLPDYGYIASSWSWARRRHSVTWMQSMGYDGVFVPECQWEDISITNNSSNPFGGITSAHIQMNARILQLFPPGDGRKLSNTESDDSLFLGFVFHFAIRSSTGKYIANFRLDWLSCGCSEGECPDGPLGDIWMVLLTSGTFQQEHTSWTSTGDREVTDPECMLGLLLLPTQNANEFIKVGVWYSESRDLGGRKLWDNVQGRSIKLV